jgi:hypothetical protein
MRRQLMLFLGVALLGAAPGFTAMAQSKRDQEDQRRKAEAEADAKKKKKEKDWASNPAPLASVRNAGPCPFAKVLYDASRWVELKDNQERAEMAGFTGEIQGVKARCEYKAGEPIRVAMNVGFTFGKGPQAQGQAKDYRYWVAVTVRNQAILDKQVFDVRAVFPPGQDRVVLNDAIQTITIPRADDKVNGSNFEILVGFDVTPQMADFNRLGKRFRVNAGETTQTASAAGTPPRK